MAETTETTVLKVVVNGKELAIDNIKSAKQAIKDLNSEILAGNQQAIKSLADVKDKLEDIKEATETVKGSGVEKLTSSFRLLGDGFKSLDLDKIKTGFKGVGSAMSAIPLILIIEGIAALAEKFKIIEAIVEIVTDGINAFTDAIGLTTVALEKQTKQIIEQYDAQIKKIQARYSAEISYAAAAGQNVTSLERSKLQEVEDSIKKQLEASELLLIEKKKLSDEELKRHEQLQEDLYAATYARVTKEAELNKKFSDLVKSSDESLASSRLQGSQLAIYQVEKERDARLKALKDVSDQVVDSDAEYLKLTAARAEIEQEAEIKISRIRADEFKKRRDKLKADEDKLFSESISDEENYLADSESLRQAADKESEQNKLAGLKLIADAEKQFRDDAVQQAKDNAAKQKQLDKDIANNRLQVQNTSLQAAKGLSDLFFQIQENGARGNAQKLNEIAKKKFAVDKAFNIAQATIDGIRSVQAALTIPPPFGQILAVANGVLAAANVAKIAATQFTGTASTSAPSDIGGSISVAAPPPPLALGQATAQNNSTYLNTSQPQPQKVILVETDVRQTTQNIIKTTLQAKFP